MRTLQIVNIVCAVTIADQELFTFVLTMPPKKKLKRPDNQGLISNLFKSSTQDKPFNPVSSQTLPGPESDKQPVTNVTESDCEHTFSQQNKILTKSRANLSSKHLDELIRVRLFTKSGSEVSTERVLAMWKASKNRKLYA